MSTPAKPTTTAQHIEQTLDQLKADNLARPSDHNITIGLRLNQAHKLVSERDREFAAQPKPI